MKFWNSEVRWYKIILKHLNSNTKQMTIFNLTKRFKFARKLDRFESMPKSNETVSLACDRTLRGFMTC